MKCRGVKSGWLDKSPTPVLSLWPINGFLLFFFTIKSHKNILNRELIPTDIFKRLLNDHNCRKENRQTARELIILVASVV